MPFIIHHNDDDGRAAGAIIYNECVRGRHYIAADQCVEWTHGMPAPRLNVSELNNEDTIYIVDLALDDDILSCITDVLKQRPDLHIVHIDHHITSIKRLEKMSSITMNGEEAEANNLYLSNVKHMFHVGHSATLLCWAYASFTLHEKQNLDMVEYDFTDNVSHVLITGIKGKSQYREIHIPMVLRYIDDYDVWRRALDPNTEYFHNAFFAVENKSDIMSDLWASFIYTDDVQMLDTFMKAGEAITRYMRANSAYMIKNAFVAEVNGHSCLALNGHGNSNVFGDAIHEFECVCIFYYDGAKKMWKYSFYSAAESECDVSKICELYGGGGHVHAAAFFLKEQTLFTI